MTPTLTVVGGTSEAERRHRLTRASALREVLRDGSWHEGGELVQRVGHRFSAALLMVRRGEDGLTPWHVEKERLTADGRVWRYRLVGVVDTEARRPKRDTVSRLRRALVAAHALLDAHGIARPGGES